MPRNIDIGLLRAFVTVVETGSVTEAAALLNLTQAAVSQQLKRLEDLFAAELFERHHKRLTLKPNGERLIAHAQRLITLNDEVWGAMSAPAYAGEVRLGVPHDIVGPYLPPILKRFDKAWPRVRVTLKCTTTPQLLDALRHGTIDLTLTTEQRCGRGGEVLLEDDLVWAGAFNGAAHRRDPLPVSLGDENCEFRTSVLKGLAETGRDWRPVCEVSSMEPLLASVEADLAVAPFLRRSIPDYLTVVEDPRLPRLPKFLINMYLPPANQNEIAVELARHIAQEFATHFRRQSGPELAARYRRKPIPTAA
ncbi:MAG TPA: LysR substrate-binding domain-containing protein [Hyphomicrobiaceae bacterium]|jgi:DNA-binding transcriptional LysR family regulator|nr:LysR substrate-binding domain-containing protein [Hyphomicrobiaceae bacterium]